jgi:hypothetical protein
MIQNNRLKGRWTRLQNYLNIGIMIVVGVIILLFSKERIALAFRLEHFPVAQLSVLLLFVTFIFISAWIKAAIDELQILQDFFPTFVPPVPRATFTLTLVVAILCGLLCYFSNIIIFYTLIFIFIKLVLLFGMYIRNSEIKITLIKSQDKSGKKIKRKKGWKVIEEYYLKKPQFQLEVIVLFFSFFSSILGLLGKIITQSVILSESAAYIVIIIIIVFNECIYIKWRNERDIKLNKYYN